MACIQTRVGGRVGVPSGSALTLIHRADEGLHRLVTRFVGRGELDILQVGEKGMGSTPSAAILEMPADGALGVAVSDA